MAFLGDILGGNQRQEQRRAIRQQEQLSNTLAQMYSQNMPGVLAAYSRIAGLTGYDPVSDAYNRALDYSTRAINTSSRQLLGDVLGRLANSGMMNSSVAANAISRVGLLGAQQSAELANRAMLEREQQRQAALAQLANIASGGVGTAMSGFGAAANAWGGMAQSAIQNAFTIGKALGLKL